MQIIIKQSENKNRVFPCPSVKEGQRETSIDTLDPGSRQIAVEEGRDGLAGLRDLVVVVVLNQTMSQKMDEGRLPGQGRVNI